MSLPLLTGSPTPLLADGDAAPLTPVVDVGGSGQPLNSPLPNTRYPPTRMIVGAGMSSAAAPVARRRNRVPPRSRHTTPAARRATPSGLIAMGAEYIAPVVGVL